MTHTHEVPLPLLEVALLDRGVKVRSVTTADAAYIHKRKPCPAQVAIAFEYDPSKLEMDVANHLLGHGAHIDIFFYYERRKK